MNEYKFTNDYHEVVILKKHFSNNILLHISRDTHKQNMNDALQLKQGKKINPSSRKEYENQE